LIEQTGGSLNQSSVRNTDAIHRMLALLRTRMGVTASAALTTGVIELMKQALITGVISQAEIDAIMLDIRGKELEQKTVE
jgi:hypothetical protein